MKRFKKSLNILLKTGIGFAALLLLGFGALSVRLHQGPISLSGWSDQIQRSVESLSADLRLKIENPELAWGDWRKPFVVRAREIRVEHKQGDALKVQIPEVTMTFRLTHLLLGKFTPYLLETEQAYVYFDPSVLRKNEAETEKKKFPISYSDLISAFNAIPAQKIQLSHVTVEIPDSPYTKPLKISDLSLSYKKSFRSMIADLGFQIDQTTVRGDIKLKPGENEVGGYLSFQQYDPSIMTLFKKEAFQETPFSLVLETLEKQTLRGSFEISGLYNMRMKLLETASLKVSDLSGELDIRPLIGRPLKIKGGEVDLSYEDNHVSAKNLRVSVDGIDTGADLEGAFNPETGVLSLEVETQARSIPFDELKTYWPKGLADIPRTWVTGRISKGICPRATLHTTLGLSYGDQGLKMTVEQLKGEIQVKDATVRYMDELPTVTNVDGTALYTNKEMAITISKGKSGGIHLKGGKILINGLDVEDQHIEILLGLTSPLKNAVAFIEQKPLEFAQKFRLKSQYVLGEAEDIQLSLKFPLEQSVTLNQVKADVKAKVKNFTSKSLLKGIKADIVRGNLDVHVSNEAVSLVGDIEISGAPSHLTLKQTFKDKKEPIDLLLKSALTKNLLDQNQIPGFDAFIGHLPYELKFKGSEEDGYHLDMTADLAPVTLNAFGWEKQAKTPGTLNVKATLSPQGEWTLHTLKGTCGDSLRVEIAGESQEGRIKHFEVKSFRLGKTDLSGHIDFVNAFGYAVVLQGPRLNLEPFMLLSKGKKNTFTEPLKLTLRVDRLDFGEERYFRGNDLFLIMKEGLIRQLTYSALLESQSRDPMIRVVIESNPETKVRTLTLKSDHAGKVLKALDISNNVSGGKLKIIATHAGTSDKVPWKGKLQIKDFALKEAPLMSKLLTLAFPTGIIDLMSDKGLPFNKFRVNFSYTPSKIVLKDGRANGISLGMTVNGTIDQTYDQLHLQGSVIPAQMLNTFLSKVPLVGELITGGKHEGLFAISYSIEGPISAARVFANPISVLTPGFLRKIFEKDLGEKSDSDDDDRDLEDL